MGRAPRASAGGVVYHVLNRANDRRRLFAKPADYAAFELALDEACDRFGQRCFAYCVMPNHWHLVLRPDADGVLSRFVGWLTLTHTQRWRAHHDTIGAGHLYQGRFRSFPVQADAYFLAVCRYVEANPVRAGLVSRAADWRWGRAARRERGGAAAESRLAPWPVEAPAGWLTALDTAQPAAQLGAIREAVTRGRPLGEAAWTRRTARDLGLEATLRPRCRPRKISENA